MNPNPASIAAYVDACADLLGLPIAPEHREGVELQLSRLAAVAASVAEQPLGYADEPAPLFHPGKRT